MKNWLQTFEEELTYRKNCISKEDKSDKKKMNDILNKIM